MSSNSLNTSRATSISLVILATVAVFYVLVVGKSILVPVAVAVMIWYVINALSRSYSKLLPWVKGPNWLTTLMSLTTIGLFLAFSVDMVQNNIADVSAAAPEYKRNFDALSGKIIQQFNLQNLPNVNQMVEGIEIAPLITALAGTFTNMISGIFIVLIYVLFMMLEQSTFNKKISAIFPDNLQRDSVLSILSHAQEDIQTYLWIKTITSMITGVVSYFILKAVGVDFAGFWAFTIFLLNFIPTIGSIIATLFPAILTLIQFDTFGPFLVVLLGVGSVQVAVGNFLEPKLMGTSLNVSPLVVMLSLTLWGSVWGVAGMFLSVPITVMLLIVFAHFEQTRHLAILLSGNGSLKFAEDKSTLASPDQQSKVSTKVMREQVVINDVGPRDGLQNQPKILSPAEKVAMVKSLLSAGLKHIEVGAFVSLKAVPAMAGSEQVLAALDQTQAELSVLVPNQKGYQLALSAGGSILAMVAYGTEGFAQKNVNMSRAKAKQATLDMAAQAQQDGVKLLATISTAFECPFDGKADPGVIANTTAEFLEAGVDTVMLGDTIGAANPVQVSRLMNRLIAENGSSRLGCHFHDTRAMGMANVYAALETGIRRFDASIAGLGGCPFAPGATGNVATEDVVMMLEQMGFETGVDLDALMRASNLASELTGTAPGGRAKAWLKPYLAKQAIR